MTANASISYSIGLPADWLGQIRFDYSYTSHATLLFDRPASPVMGGYHLGSLSLSATRGGVTAGAAVDNLWNAAADSFAFGNPFSLPFERQRTPLRPRTVTLFVSYRF